MKQQARYKKLLETLSGVLKYSVALGEAYMNVHHFPVKALKLCKN